ncbi:MAG: LysM peptidoglycan-binding domain-containing protein [Acidimicrobiaceae bacterium]
MAAIQIEEFEVLTSEEAMPYLRLVTAQNTPQSFRTGVPLAVRREARELRRKRRIRLYAGLVLAGALVILLMPGAAFGGVTGTGLSTDIASSAELASGMVYVVQPGDTLSSISKMVNPVSPQKARTILVAQLGSSVVIAGEHILIP